MHTVLGGRSVRCREAGSVLLALTPDQRTCAYCSRGAVQPTRYTYCLPPRPCVVPAWRSCAQSLPQEPCKPQQTKYSPPSAYLCWHTAAAAPAWPRPAATQSPPRSRPALRPARAPLRPRTARARCCSCRGQRRTPACHTWGWGLRGSHGREGVGAATRWEGGLAGCAAVHRHALGVEILSQGAQLQR
jgi:hypothetical protein